MTQDKVPTSPAVDTPDFDLLRARLEAEVERPAVIAITSSTAEDGNDVAAWGLACSLAATGYPTAFIDTRASAPTFPEPAQRLRLDDIVAQLSASREATSFAVLTLADPALQRRTSQRNIASAFDLLRGKFDYIVVAADSALSSPFAAALITAADSVLVAVKLGRRERNSDVKLSTALSPLGLHFLGIVALDPSVIPGASTLSSAPAPMPESRPLQSPQTEREPPRTEVAEWSTKTT